jgi:queuine tRNA-ribosyltransferase
MYELEEAPPPVTFRLEHRDPATAARSGVLRTPHGLVDTPAFMPVGTQGSVKGLMVDDLMASGTQIILANTYHLALRPGAQVVAELGGLHRFTGWPGPILTDSGGFQLFSLAQHTRITEQGADFRSHIDGQAFSLSPERAVEIQELLGSDMAMVLDHVVALPSDTEAIRDATERTVRWAERCRRAATRSDQALFAIVQGGLDPQLRAWCAERLVEMDFPGYAVGGLSVGEEPEDMYRVLDHTVPLLPQDKPRYLMGVGRPIDLLEGIARGIDLFDCVMPTRNGRNALAFTDQGTLRLRNLVHRNDSRPLEQHCTCPACRTSRGYLRHLFTAGEMLGPILLSIHNVTYYQRLMSESRRAIRQGRFDDLRRGKAEAWSRSEDQSEA